METVNDKNKNPKVKDTPPPNPNTVKPIHEGDWESFKQPKARYNFVNEALKHISKNVKIIP